MSYLSLFRRCAASFIPLVVLSSLLQACGGGGGSGTTPPPPAALAISPTSPVAQAGGEKIALTANMSATWSLAAGSPGNLDGSAGASVNYVPPAGGTIAADVDATVVATAGGVSQSVRIRVQRRTGLFLAAGQTGGAGRVDAIGTEARFSRPLAMATDTEGIVYLLDTPNALRRIGTGGEVSTHAGQFYREGNEDGERLSASFTASAIAAGATGIYLADPNAVRKIGLDGKLVTIAGKAGDARFADGDAAGARFYKLLAMALDTAGNLILLDAGPAGLNGRVRKLSADGKVTTLAGGDGKLPLNPNTDMRAVAVDAGGNVYIAGDIAIKKLTQQGDLVLVAGGYLAGEPRMSRDGTGSAARFTDIHAMSVDAAGNLLVADGAVRKVTPGGVVTTVVNGTNVETVVSGANGSAYFSERYFMEGTVIRAVNAQGQVGTLAGKLAAPVTQADGPAMQARFATPEFMQYQATNGIVADAAGKLYLAEAGNIRKIDVDGTVSTFAGTLNQPPGSFTNLKSLAADRQGTLYAVAGLDDAGTLKIRKFASSGTTGDLSITAAEFIPARSDPTESVTVEVALAVDGGGGIWLAWSRTSAFTGGLSYTRYKDGGVMKVASDGTVTRVTGGAAMLAEAGTSAIAVDAAGNLYAFVNSTLRKLVPSTGNVTTLAGTPGMPGWADGGGAAARFGALSKSIAVDPDGNVYVADEGNRAVRMVTPAGAVTTVAGNGAYTGPNTTEERGMYDLRSAPGLLPHALGVAWVGPKLLAIASGSAVVRVVLP